MYTSQVAPELLAKMLHTRVDTARDIGLPRLLDLQTHFGSSDVHMQLCFNSVRDAKVLRQKQPSLAPPDMSDTAFKLRLNRTYGNMSLRQQHRHTSLMLHTQPPRSSLGTVQACNMHQQYAHTLCIIGRGRYQFNHGYLNLGHFDRLLTIPMAQTTRIALTCENQGEVDQQAADDLGSEAEGQIENELGLAQDHLPDNFNQQQQDEIHLHQLNMAVLGTEQQQQQQPEQQQQQQPEETDQFHTADPDEPASEDFVTSDPDTPTDPDADYQPPSSETTADTD